MQGARPAVETYAVPIEDAIGRVAVLLDFHDEASRADGVAATAGDEDGIALSHRNPVKLRLHRTLRECALEGSAVHAALEASVDSRIAGRAEEIPHLGFRLATQL